jgi:hypothetical protein
MKDDFSGLHLDSVEELFHGPESLWGGISADFLQRVVLEWERQLQVCCDSGGEYAE